LDERTFIQWLGSSGSDAQALQDDAFYDALTRQVYTSDILVDGRHFNRAYCSAQDIGWKAAAVNLSDIAAMGAVPLYLLVSIVVPETFEFDWLQKLYEGLYQACDVFQTRIVGGDTVGGDVFTINVTAIGVCPPDSKPAHRWLAKTGDLILTTGYHGLSHVGLLSLQAAQRGYPVSQEMHRRPQPQLPAGLSLCKALPRVAMMDSSDGLADALLKIAEASQQALVLESSRLAIHPEIQSYAEANGLDPLALALYGGEDFQLIATVPQQAWQESPTEVQEQFQVLGYVADTATFLERMPAGELLLDSSCPLTGAWLFDDTQTTWTALDRKQTFQHF
jgi:thiamine-monophosphate kinase